MLDFHTPLAEVNGIGQNFIAKLKRMGISTAGELLSHFPARYEDFSQIYNIADLIPNQEATIRGQVEEIEGHAPGIAGISTSPNALLPTIPVPLKPSGSINPISKILFSRGVWRISRAKCRKARTEISIFQAPLTK